MKGTKSGVSSGDSYACIGSNLNSSVSFEFISFLDSAKLGINKHTGQVQRLISWKNAEDPAPGMFSVGIDPNGKIGRAHV